MARKNPYKDNRIVGPFLPMPRDVLDSPAFLHLSAHAKALLLDLGTQYRGNNNGDLQCAWKLMKLRGWRSEATLHKAKRELLDAGLIFEARKGRRPNVCGLYALTWFLFDASPKHDCTPAAFRRGAYRLGDPLPMARKPIQNAGVTTPPVAVKAG